MKDRHIFYIIDDDPIQADAVALAVNEVPEGFASHHVVTRKQVSQQTRDALRKSLKKQVTLTLPQTVFETLSKTGFASVLDKGWMPSKAEVLLYAILAAKSRDAQAVIVDVKEAKPGTSLAKIAEGSTSSPFAALCMQDQTAYDFSVTVANICKENLQAINALFKVANNVLVCIGTRNEKAQIVKSHTDDEILNAIFSTSSLSQHIAATSEKDVQPAASPMPQECAGSFELPDVVLVACSNEEDCLRHSLRALEKNGSCFGRVIVAGHAPRWLSGKALAVQVDKKLPQSQLELECLKAAVKQCKITKPFLFGSSSVVLLAPTSMAALPSFHLDNELPSKDFFQSLASSGQSWLVSSIDSKLQRLLETRMLLEDRGLPTKNFECGGFTWADPKHLSLAKRILRKSDASVQCILGNLFEKDHQVQQASATAACAKPAKDAEQLRKAAKSGTQWCSISNEAGADLYQALHEAFPLKSGYEACAGSSVAVCWIGPSSCKDKLSSFLASAEEKLLPGFHKTYYVFSDFLDVAVDAKLPCTFIQVPSSEFGKNGTVLRKFKHFLAASNELSKHDYVAAFSSKVQISGIAQLNDVIDDSKKYAVAALQYGKISAGTQFIDKRSAASFCLDADADYVLSDFIFCQSADFLKLANSVESQHCYDIANDVPDASKQNDDPYLTKAIALHQNDAELHYLGSSDTFLASF